MGKKSRKITKFRLILTFPWGRQNFETIFGYVFSGTIAKKIINHAPLTLSSWEKIWPPKFFLGGGAPPLQGVHKLDIMTHYHL